MNNTNTNINKKEASASETFGVLILLIFLPKVAVAAPLSVKS